MSAPILLQQVTVISPARTQEPADVLLAEGKVKFLPPGATLPAGCRVIPAQGKILLPGMFDLQAHLREPGREDAESIISGAAAAVNGGFTGLLLMPDTSPPLE